MLMKLSAFIFVVLIAIASSQDVSVPPDLLGTSTKASNVTDFEYSDDEVTEETTTEEDSSWVGGNNETADLPPPDSLVRPQFPSVTPIPLPPFQSNCTIQLPVSYYPSNQPPIIIPPIFNSTIDPVQREETLICPVGSVKFGSVCNTTYSNECTEGYTFDGDRCVIKFTNCPLNFELNEFGRCVQRQICPNNHAWKNGRCVAVTQCPTGWKWDGEKCEVKTVECQPGSILRGSECVTETFTCPIGWNEDDDKCIAPKVLCPAGYEMKDNGFCSKVTLLCPPGSALINNECRRTTISCPTGSYQVGNQCYKYETERPEFCPPGFELVGDMCNMVSTQRPTDIPEFVCPPGTYKIGNACYYYPSSTNSPTISCPTGFYAHGNRCLPIQYPSTESPPIEVVECLDGYYKVGNTCYPTSTERPSTRPPFICPPGFYRDGSRCLSTQNNVKCPQDYYEVSGQCYPNADPSLPPGEITSTPKTFHPTHPSYPGKPQCPDGYVFFKNHCYRCPANFDLCENKCVRSGHACGNLNYPNININIYSRDHRATTGKGYNIINHIEPINNTIVNINNVTHPVTLNNVVENNIYVYSHAQCPDGSIKTILVKNNETVNGCLDMDSDKRPDDTEDETSKRCCEVITPRQCKKRDSNQWMCTHRRHQYCGKFCIADRLYLKPPSTSYQNNVLTILPSPPIGNSPPCFGPRCPPVDCSGCIDGSFNCSTVCYTYPCNHASCHYLSQKDFCNIVGGEICEPVW